MRSVLYIDKEMKQGFPPIADKSATVLILGSMPSEESLNQNQYYAHPRNAFWKIIGTLFDFQDKISYAQRSNILTQNKIALWDVIQACQRPGSLDSAIDADSIIANDFVEFFRNHPNINVVVFNGAKAEAEYRKRVLPLLDDKQKAIEYIRLPSTSPAMASLSFEDKLLLWSDVKNKVR